MDPRKSERRTPERRSRTGGTPPPGTVVDRRLGLERREPAETVGNGLDAHQTPGGPGEGLTGPETQLTGLERRRGPGRRLSRFTKAAEEGEMTTEQFLFLMAIDAFKKSNDRMFPTWTDVLEVIRLLGYRKTMPSELRLNNADDWRERADAPSDVRPQRWAERFGRARHERDDMTGAHLEDRFDDEFDEEFDDRFASDTECDDAESENPENEKLENENPESIIQDDAA